MLAGCKVSSLFILFLPLSPSQAFLWCAFQPTLSCCVPTHATTTIPIRLSLCLQIRPVELQAAGLVNWNSRVLRPGQRALCFPPKHLQAPRQPHTCFRIHTHTLMHTKSSAQILSNPPANILHFTNAKQLKSCEQVGFSILLKETKRGTVYLQI